MGTRTINVSLGNIDKALKELQSYKKEFLAKEQFLLKRCVEEGVNIAKELCPVDFGDLQKSIQGRVEDSTGYIYTESPYAVFVEFGFGIVGATNPHPEVPPGWTYDSNSHGKDGWVYFDVKRNEFRWSNGQPSKPFMWQTAQRLSQLIPKLAREVFK